ncbi:MAG: type II secretion system protein [Candidatus Curtissbacteria bacterium]
MANLWFHRSFRAFTLIELLIAISILGILAAGVLVAVNPVKRQNQAKDAQIKADTGQIATAAQSYFSSGSGIGSYPADLETLVTNQDLKNLPTPPTSAAYEYVVTAWGGGVCDATIANPCTYARLSEPLQAPAASGNVWCWQSSTGQAQELTIALCTP